MGCLAVSWKTPRRAGRFKRYRELSEEPDKMALRNSVVFLLINPALWYSEQVSDVLATAVYRCVIREVTRGSLAYASMER